MENIQNAEVADFGKVEYRVKPITRYVVTRFEECPGGNSAVTERGTYENPDVAWEVGYAMCKLDHERMGYPVGDPRIQYPRHPLEPKGTTGPITPPDAVPGL